MKPARAGSSVGVSRVTDASGIPEALTVAFAEDSVVLIESGVAGREVEIAVLQGRDGSAPRTSSVLGEIVFTGRDFYDFEAKYLGAAGVELALPAKLNSRRSLLRFATPPCKHSRPRSAPVSLESTSS